MELTGILSVKKKIISGELAGYHGRLGLSEAAGESGNKEFLKKLIFAQVRNVLLNKSFHEVMDVDTGRAWRWPHLPWHAAGFIGFIVNGVFGIRYSEQGIQVHPCILDEFEGAVLDSVPYQNAKFVFEIHGHVTAIQ